MNNEKYILAIRDEKSNVVGYFVDYNQLPTMNLHETQEYSSVSMVNMKRMEIIENGEFLLDNETVDILVI